MCLLFVLIFLEADVRSKYETCSSFPSKKNNKKADVNEAQKLRAMQIWKQTRAARFHKDDLIAVVSFLFLFIFAKVSIVLWTWYTNKKKNSTQNRDGLQNRVSRLSGSRTFYKESEGETMQTGAAMDGGCWPTIDGMICFIRGRRVIINARFNKAKLSPEGSALTEEKRFHVANNLKGAAVTIETE